MKSIIFTISPDSVIRLPYAHFEMLQGLFYKLLSFNNEYSTFLHNKQTDNHAACKLFCFSDIGGKYENVDNQLIYSGELTWEIRVAEDRTIDIILENIFNRRRFSLNNCPFMITDIELTSIYIPDQPFYFEMSTPIVTYKTENNKTIYYSPEDDEFYEIIESNMRNKYYSVFGEDYDGEFRLICNYCTDKYKRVTRYKGTIINGWLGKFTMEADIAMIYTAYYCGIGSKNSMGFGMIKQRL